MSIDPASRRLVGIAIKQGRFFGKVVYTAFEHVTGASSEGVKLDVKRGELATVAPFGVNLDDKSVVERVGSTHAGVLKLVAVHPGSGELAYIVAHNLRPGHDVMLRAEYVTALAPERVSVTIADDALNALPSYRSDAELQQDVEAVLFDFTPMHIDLKGIKARVLDGVLYLDGNISSSLRSDIAQDQVYGVEGLLEVKNNLLADDSLANDISQALAQDPRTRGLSIGVYPRLGEVRLSGAARTAQQKAAAEEIARNVPGTRSVLNTLVIDPKADMLYVMSSAEGGEMEDKVPGKYVRHTQ
ncbi:MAG TPA: BON domain-containing protein [Chthonomonadales bacterium]|nr:BON domain-containing protein [Chthonomonadales bacterium]